MEIIITGMRPSEKLHEDLTASDESGERRVHKLITHVAAPALAPSDEMVGGPVPDPARMRAISLTGLPAGANA